MGRHVPGRHHLRGRLGDRLVHHRDSTAAAPASCLDAVRRSRTTRTAPTTDPGPPPSRSARSPPAAPGATSGHDRAGLLRHISGDGAAQVRDAPNAPDRLRGGPRGHGHRDRGDQHQRLLHVWQELDNHPGVQRHRVPAADGMYVSKSSNIQLHREPREQLRSPRLWAGCEGHQTEQDDQFAGVGQHGRPQHRLRHLSACREHSEPDHREPRLRQRAPVSSGRPPGSASTAHPETRSRPTSATTTRTPGSRSTRAPTTTSW